MQIAWDLPSWRIGAAPHLELASVTVLFAGTIKARALRCDARSWFCICSMELDQFLTSRTSVSVLLRIKHEVSTRKGAVRTVGFVEHWNVRRDLLLLDQPS